MYTKDAIRYSLTMADQLTMRSLATIEDAPLTFPTENGGCHPLWVMGHLAFVEGLTHEMLGGGTNPVAHWARDFRAGHGSHGGPGAVPGVRESPGPICGAQESQSAASRIDDRGGSGSADGLAAEGP